MFGNNRRLVGVDFTEAGATVSYQKKSNVILSFLGVRDSFITETEEYVTKDSKWWHCPREDIYIPVRDEATLTLLTPPMHEELTKAYETMEAALEAENEVEEFQFGLDIYMLFSKHSQQGNRPLQYKDVPVRPTHARAGFGVLPRFKGLIEAKK